MPLRSAYADDPSMQEKIDEYINNHKVAQLHIEIVKMEDRLECNRLTLRALMSEIERGEQTLSSFRIALEIIDKDDNASKDG